jgi:DNA polymerase III epsilon subunit-like protein
MTTQQDFLSLYSHITALLRLEETVAPVSGLADWQARQAQRTDLSNAFHQLERMTAELRRRFDTLPRLPHPEHVAWAQAMLAFANLTFLEVDTDGLTAEADLLRITLVDREGAVLFDQVIQPRSPLTAKIAQITGIKEEHLADAPRLAEVWEAVRAAMSGRYILSFNLEFDQQQLATNTRRAGLLPPTIIGDCLMLRAQEYFEEYQYPRLVALCERLGFPLPEHPGQDALDRARGQLHLLEAMAAGISVAAPSVPASEGDAPVEEGDPFLPDFSEEQE